MCQSAAWMLIESIGALAMPIATRNKVPVLRARVDDAPASAAPDAARTGDDSAVIVAIATALQLVCQIDALVPLAGGIR